jgi:DNA-binding transcriptional regulator YhcF (GntR family)
MLKKPEQGKEKASQAGRRKWGNTLIDAGYAITPIVLIEHFVEATGLDSVDLHIIEFLNAKWWYAESKPFPSKAAIAKATGIHENTVRRRIQKMERKGLIRREQRRNTPYNNMTNIYLLDGLIKVMEPFAAREIQDRKAKQALRAAHKGGRPVTSKLQVVK